MFGRCGWMYYMNEFGEGWENFRKVLESLPDLGRRTYIYNVKRQEYEQE
jgi:hypothetical protein